MRYFSLETNHVRLTWEGPSRSPSSPPLVIETQRLDADTSPALHTLPDAPGLTEQTRYWLMLESCDGRPVALRHANPTLLGNLHILEGGRLWHGSLHFGSYAGRTVFVVWHDGRPHLRLELEVFPSRLAYRSDYEAILADLETWTVEPALRFASGFWQHGHLPTGLPDQTPGWVARLAAVLNALEAAFQRITQQPLTDVQRLRRWQPLEAIRYPDALLQQAMQTGSGYGPKVYLAGQHTHRFQQGSCPVVTTDTPEHQWLAWQLDHTRRQMQRLLAATSTPNRLSRPETTAQVRWKALAQLLARLEALQRRLPSTTHTSLPPPPSPRLLRAEGYRQAYQILQWLRRRLSLLGGLFSFEVGQIYVLYEYWCYLVLVRLLSQQTGRAFPLDRLFTLSDDGLHLRPVCGRGLRFPLPDGGQLRLVYNPRWGTRSLLVPQQPDLLLSCLRPGKPPVHYVLDAKYRLDDSPAYVRRYGVPGPPTEALNDLHRYRDALSSYFARRDGSKVAQALALYPYRENETGRFAKSRLARALAENGIGAIPLLPNATEYLKVWLRNLIA